VADGWLLAAVAFVLYAALAPSHVVDGDNAEFATLGAIGGRAHPSGYPAYVLWLRLWSWLPGTAAHGSAIATAILGALVVFVLRAACSAWGARPLSALAAAAIFAAAPIVLHYHCEAEVFAMNELIAALVLWLSAQRGPLRGPRRALALGIVAGLGMSNHLTCVLVAPVGVLGVVRAARESRASAYALAIAGLAVGLSCYAYLFLADGPASWGRVDTAADLVRMISRHDYGVTSLMTGGADVPASASLLALIATLSRTWLWLPALAGLLALGARIIRPSGETRTAWCLLALSFLLAGPVLMARFNIDPHGIGLDTVQRFHILPALLLAIPVSAAGDLASARVARDLAPMLACVIAFVALSLADLPRLQAVHSPAVEIGLTNTIRSLPPAAIALVTQDDQCFGLRYLQLTRGERPDVAVVCTGLLPVRSYRASWAERGVRMPPSDGPRLAEALFPTARPVFADQLLRPILTAFPGYPLGVLVRILPPGASPPPAAEVAARNRDLYRGFGLDYVYPGRDDGYATLAHHRYAAIWASIARMLDRSGDRDAARDAFALTQELAPAD
jgi:hypothetical protein